MALDGIVYRNDHPAPRGAGKGSALTSDEFDNNFYELYTRLKSLEDNPPTATGISNISVAGSQLLISMSDGHTTYGPFTLPIATFKLRGDYVAGTAYAELDLVSVPNQGLYLVRIAHTGEDPFNENADDGSGHALYLKVFGEDVAIYDVGFFYPGKPGQGIESAGYMFAHKFVRPTILPTSMPDSKGSLRAAAQAALSFPLKKNGTSIGSVDFAAAGTQATFTFTADIPFAAGDEIQVGPAIASDATAKDLSLTLAFTRTF